MPCQLLRSQLKIVMQFRANRDWANTVRLSWISLTPQTSILSYISKQQTEQPGNISFLLSNANEQAKDLLKTWTDHSNHIRTIHSLPCNPDPSKVVGNSVLVISFHFPCRWENYKFIFVGKRFFKITLTFLGINFGTFGRG